MSYTESIGEKETILIVVGCLITILNLIEIAIIIKKRLNTSLKPYEKLMLSLAISDLIVALAVVAFKACDIILKDPGWLNGDNFTLSLLFSLSFSVDNILPITVDRFLAVKYPISHRVLMTNRRTNAFIVIIWVLSVFTSATWAFFVLVIKIDLKILFLVVSTFLVAFGIVMISVYLFIIHVAVNRKRFTGGRPAQNHRQKFSSFFTDQEHKQERNILCTCCLVTLSYIACSYPFSIEVFARQGGDSISFASKLILFLNSAMNPLVYFFKGFLEKRVKEHNTNVTPKE